MYTFFQLVLYDVFNNRINHFHAFCFLTTALTRPKQRQTSRQEKTGTGHIISMKDWLIVNVDLECSKLNWRSVDLRVRLLNLLSDPFLKGLVNTWSNTALGKLFSWSAIWSGEGVTIKMARDTIHSSNIWKNWTIKLCRKTFSDHAVSNYITVNTPTEPCLGKLYYTSPLKSANG